jgi:hypothetical protein
MEENLEHRVEGFRKKMLGKKLSEKYPLEPENDDPLYPREMSGPDTAKFILKTCGKVMIPYTGDKLMIDYVRLENEIHPKDKWFNYFNAAAAITGRYLGLGLLALHLVG